MLWARIAAAGLILAIGFVLLSPLLGVHLHSNGKIHSHSTQQKHNQNDKSIPAQELPGLVPGFLFSKVTFELSDLLTLGAILSLFALAYGKFPVPDVKTLPLETLRIRDGTPAHPGFYSALFARPPPHSFC